MKEEEVNEVYMTMDLSTIDETVMVFFTKKGEGVFLEGHLTGKQAECAYLAIKRIEDKAFEEGRKAGYKSGVEMAEKIANDLAQHYTSFVKFDEASLLRRCAKSIRNMLGKENEDDTNTKTD